MCLLRFVSAAAVECFLFTRRSCQSFSKHFKVSLFSSFLIKWVGWYKLCEFKYISGNAINCFDDLKIKRSYCFMLTFKIKIVVL